MPPVTLRSSIRSYCEISQNAIALLEDIGLRSSINKNDFLLKEGKSDMSEYIVMNGVCRTCVFGHDGTDTTLSFYTVGMVLPPHVIRVKNGVSIFNAQASTDLELIRFDVQQFEQFMIENLEIRQFGNEVLKFELNRMLEKEVNMASLSAKERLIRFRQQFKGLENIIPHSDIASYIGVTAVSLSRLRKELIST